MINREEGEKEKRKGKGKRISQNNGIDNFEDVSTSKTCEKCIVADNDSPEKQQKPTMEDKLHSWMRSDRSEERSRSAMANDRR